MEQAACSVFDTDFEPYMKSGNNKDTSEYKLFLNEQGIKVSRKMRNFNNDVPVPGQNLAPSVTATGKLEGPRIQSELSKQPL